MQKKTFKKKPFTPPKFNMEPENHPLEKENTSSKSSFLGSMLVFGGVHIVFEKPSRIFAFSEHTFLTRD